MTRATPARALLLVRPVESADAFAGSRLVIPDTVRERLTAHQVECIAVGAPEVCDDEDCERDHFTYMITGFPSLGGGPPPEPSYVERTHPCNVRPGDWLLVRPRSALAGPEPERDEWFMRQDDVLAILREDTDNAELDA